MQTPKAKFLIVDTSAFINQVSLHHVGENVITIPEVIAEVRNKRQNRHLLSLTHDVELKDVFSESIVFVTEFAKKTGDYACLSATDIKLIALTYQLEVEKVGRTHLRDSPIVSQYDVNVKTKKVQQNTLNGLCLPVKMDENTELHNAVERKVSNNIEEEEDDDDVYSSGEEALLNNEQVDASNSEDEDGYETANENVSDYDVDSEVESESDSGGGEVEDDEFGWITPNNINELKSSSNESSVEDKCVTVGCLTTDFAIQNVLMQMGLNVVTVDGKIIKELRTYVLRCHACFKVTPNMKRVFCPKCGHRTLKRVSVFIDKEGNKRMFINFKRPISTKGKRFPLPLPQSGKHAVNPKLVADGRRPHQKPTKLAKMKTDALDTDYIAGSAPFVMRDIHSRSAQHGFNKGKYVFKYWMQKNPNEPKRHSKK